ncbi:Pyoverdine/dityrosine biosynthesis protein, partial [Avibacterium avium]
RKSAWEAAKRYVSISLTDRKLDTLYLEDNRFIKCTIHKKQKEFNFITTSKGDYSRTAQHTVGGLTKKFSVNYRYRIEREDLNEQAVYLKYNSQDNNDSPLNLISLNKQPIYYIS